MRTIDLFLLTTILLSSFFFTSCQKDPETGTPNNEQNPDPIQIGCLMVGQQSSFIRFTGDKYFVPSENNITYHADTLVMEVVSEDNGKFMIKESLTPGSVSVVTNAIPNADTVYFFLAEVAQDTVWFEPVSGEYSYSWFFTEVVRRNSQFVYNSRSYLPFASFGDPEIQFLGWKTTISYSETYKEAHMINQTLLGHDYPFLNARIDNSSMAFDGPGYTFIYEPKGVLVRSSYVNWWTMTGGGWARL